MEHIVLRFARQAKYQVGALRYAIFVRKLDGCHRSGSVVTAVDELEGAIVERFHAIFKHHKTTLLKFSQIAQQLIRHAIGACGNHNPHHIINGNSLGIQCLEPLQRGVCACVRLKICEKLHALIFPREKPHSTLQLLRQAQGRIAVRGVERLVVAINAATHPFSAIAIRTSESCIDGQFLHPKGEMLIQKVGISAI